jgi:secretion/DNA translocation related CpaE-like protein
VTAARTGRSALLVDGDPLGGGVDLVFGGEHDRGLRWPGLLSTRGRVPGAALSGALPRMQGLAVLSWDRSAAEALPVEALDAVLSAGCRAHELVVVDLPRHLDDAGRVVLAAATTAVLVVPTEVRAAAAASRVAASVGGLCADLRVVTRGPSPSGLGGDQVAGALGLPLLAEMRAEPGIDLALEHGQAPGPTGTGGRCRWPAAGCSTSSCRCPSDGPRDRPRPRPARAGAPSRRHLRRDLGRSGERCGSGRGPA